METKFQTSFIPKANMAPNVPVHTRRPTSFFLAFAFVIFLINVVLAAGAYTYSKYYLVEQEDNISTNLDKNVKAFEPDTIKKYAKLDTRIDTARYLIENHIAVSYFLDFLSLETLKSVSFTDMKYELSADGKSANISMNGLASGYNAVAFQSSVFGKNSNLKDMIFSNLDLDKLGNVVFNLSMKVEPGFIYYKKNINDFLKKDQTSMDIESSMSI